MVQCPCEQALVGEWNIASLDGPQRHHLAAAGIYRLDADARRGAGGQECGLDGQGAHAAERVEQGGVGQEMMLLLFWNTMV